MPAHDIIPEELTPKHLAQFLEDFRATLKEIARNEGDDYLVDEYLPRTLAADAETSIFLVPQFRRLTEIIDHIIITGPASGLQSTINQQGQQTAPPINTQIVSSGSGNLQPGATYQLNWTVSLDGTPAAGDVNNFQLRAGSATVQNSQNDGAVGRYPQEPVIFTEPNPAVSYAIRSGGTAGTAGAIYTADLEIVAVTYGVTLQLGDRIWANLALPPTGVLEISPKFLLLSSTQIRQLTATFPGQYSLELLGRAYVGKRTGIRS